MSFKPEVLVGWAPAREYSGLSRFPLRTLTKRNLSTVNIFPSLTVLFRYVRILVRQALYKVQVGAAEESPHTQILEASTSKMVILGAQKRSFLRLVATLISILIAWPCPSYSLATASTLHNSSETDRQALLCLKSQLSSPAGALDSWRDD